MAKFKSSFIIEMMDRFSIPFRSVTKEAAVSSDKFKETSKAIRGLNDKLTQIDVFHKNRNAAAKLKEEYQKSIIKIGELSKKMQEADKPTKALREEFKAAQRESARLSKAHEHMTEKVTKTASKLKELGITKRNIAQETRRLRDEEESLTKTLERQKKRIDDANRRGKVMDAAGKKKDARQESAQRYAIVGDSMSQMGGNIMSKLRGPAEMAIDFEAQMSGVSAMALGDIKDPAEKMREFQRLKDQAIELGGATSFSATEVAAAQEELAKAGIKYGDITNGVVSGLLDVARAGKLGLEEATSISTSVMRGFGIETGKLGQVGDILSYTANISSTDIKELGEVFKEVAPIAKTAGLDIKSVSGMIASLANVGIRGSVAGTALKNMILNLAKPSASGAKALSGLGVATQVAGKFRPLTEILSEVNAKTAKMGEAKRIGIFEAISGREGLAGFAALVDKAGSKEGLEELRAIELGFDNVSGSAKRMADALSDNTKGDLQELSGAWESLVLNVMEAAIPVIRDVVKAVSESVKVVTKYAKANPELTSSILGIVAGLGSFLVVGGTAFKLFSAFKMSLSVVSYGFTALRVVSSGFIQGLLGGFKLVGFGIRALTLAFGATGIGALIIAVGLAATAVWYYWDDIKAFFLGFWDDIKPKWEALSSFLSELFAPYIKLYDKYFGDKTVKVKTEAEPSLAVAAGAKRPLPESFISGPNPTPLRSPAAGAAGAASMDFSVTAPMTFNFHEKADPDKTGEAVRRELKKHQEEQERKMRAKKVDVH